jgi:hypothetical protein
MNPRIRGRCEFLRSAASDSSIKVVQCDQAFPQLRWQKKRRIGLQTAEDGVQIVIAFDLILARDCVGNS